MTMHAATVLHFLKFPRVSNRPQQTVDGRAWQIVKIVTCSPETGS